VPITAGQVSGCVVNIMQAVAARVLHVVAGRRTSCCGCQQVCIDNMHASRCCMLSNMSGMPCRPPLQALQALQRQLQLQLLGS
jgi:hypothetical protein